MGRSPGALVLGVAAGLAVAGCGGGGASHPTVTARPVAAVARCRAVPHGSHAFAATPADSMVIVKQESPSLIWETIAVRPDGTGLTTTLIGEVSGAHQNRFTLTPAQRAALRRRLAALRSPTRPTPVGAQRGFFYLVHVAGHRGVSVPGTVPTRYGALLRLLNELMAEYDC